MSIKTPFAVQNEKVIHISELEKRVDMIINAIVSHVMKS